MRADKSTKEPEGELQMAVKVCCCGWGISPSCSVHYAEQYEPLAYSQSSLETVFTLGLRAGRNYRPGAE